MIENFDEEGEKTNEAENVKVYHIHRVKTRFFVAGPKCRVGYC